MNLRIFSSKYLSSEKIAQILERIVPESLQKIFTIFHEGAGDVWVDLKL